MKRIRYFYKYIIFGYSAVNTHGFGVHSPFIYHFISFIIEEKNPYYIFKKIESLRSKLLNDESKIKINDFGTGNNRISTVREIARHQLKSAKYGQLFFRIAENNKVQNVLELGTSLGVTTAYLASASSQINCITLEGCSEVAEIARENFSYLGISNIKIVVGNIDQTLKNALDEFESLDLVFIDANHRSTALLNYFEQCLTKIHANSIILIDDIYWSTDMEKAWKKIKENPQVTATIDLFHTGIVFFNPHLYKKHYKVRF